MFLFCLVFTLFCARLFICALWSPAGKGLTSWLSFVVSSVSLSLSHWYPGSGVVLDCIDSWSLHHYLLFFQRSSLTRVFPVCYKFKGEHRHGKQLQFQTEMRKWKYSFNSLEVADSARLWQAFENKQRKRKVFKILIQSYVVSWFHDDNRFP